MRLHSRILKGASLFSAMTGLALLSGCYEPVEDMKPTTFGQDQLNRASEGRVVTILSLMPARSVVHNTNKDDDGIGSLFEAPELHPQSLIISYQDPNDPQIKSAIEIAKTCEFKTGTAYAVLIDGQTKIQPNNFEECQRIIAIKKSKGTKASVKAAVADATVAPQSSQTVTAPQTTAQATTAQTAPVQTASSNWQNKVTKPLSPTEQALQLQSQQNWPAPQTYAHD